MAQSSNNSRQQQIVRCATCDDEIETRCWRQSDKKWALIGYHAPISPTLRSWPQLWHSLRVQMLPSSGSAYTYTFWLLHFQQLPLIKGELLRSQTYPPPSCGGAQAGARAHSGGGTGSLRLLPTLGCCCMQPSTSFHNLAIHSSKLGCLESGAF